MKRNLNSQRGFTVLEMIVACTIAVLAVAAASSGMIAQYRAMQVVDLTRGATASDRYAMQSLETSLRLLGWGVDPRYAIDLYNCTSWPCRDKINGPDELAFVARNPMYSCDATTNLCNYGKVLPVNTLLTSIGATTGTLYVNGNPNNDVTLEDGRIIEVTCAMGQNPVLLTINTGGGVLTIPQNSPGVALPLTPTGGVATPYNAYNGALGTNNPNGLKSCHGVTGAYVFLVDWYHYYVSAPNDGGTPWLMLDNGLFPTLAVSGGPAKGGYPVPVAKDVVDMQVAYGLNLGTGSGPDQGNHNWVIGDVPGTQEEPAFDAGAPTYTTLLADPTRFDTHPANVRNIRVSLRIRSDKTDKTHGSTWTGDTLPYTENRNTGTYFTGQYRLYTAETDITLRNMDSTMSFLF